MLVVVVNKMCAVSLVVKDTVHPDVVVTCRSLIGFEAFLLLLFSVNLCLSQWFGFWLSLVATTVTTMALRNATIAATVIRTAAIATVSTTSLRAKRASAKEATAEAAPARSAPFSSLSRSDCKDCESRKNFHYAYICINGRDSNCDIYAGISTVTLFQFD